MLWVSSSLLWAIVGDLQMVHSFTVTTQYNRGSLGLKSRSGSYTGNTHLYSTETQVIPLQEGICKTIMKQGNGKAVRAGEIATVKYTCSALTDDETEGPFATGDSEKMTVGDASMIAGWDVALRSMQEGERCVVQITDPVKFGYGAQGIPPFVPANALLEMDLEVQKVESGFQFDGLDVDMIGGAASTAEIRANYEERMKEKAITDANKKEGIEGWIEKFNSFYFFGFFEGETGEKAPWYLRPSITFPIAFAVVGAAFWVSVSGGAIRERGAQVTDELDEIILSSTALHHAMIMAFASLPVDIAP